MAYGSFWQLPIFYTGSDVKKQMKTDPIGVSYINTCSNVIPRRTERHSIYVMTKCIIMLRTFQNYFLHVSYA